MTWISLGLIALAFVVLGLAVRPVLARLPRFARAMRRLQQRQKQAEALQSAALDLQEKATELQEQVEAAQHHVELIKARRDS